MDVEYAFSKASAKALWNIIRRERKARLSLEKTLQGAVGNLLELGTAPIACPKPGTKWTDPVTGAVYRVWWEYDAAKEVVTATNLQAPA
jgi:hypothetical protein